MKPTGYGAPYLRLLGRPMPDGISASLSKAVQRATDSTAAEVEASVDADGIAHVSITKTAPAYIGAVEISVSFEKEPKP